MTLVTCPYAWQVASSRHESEVLCGVPFDALSEVGKIVAYGRLHLWKTTVPGMARITPTPVLAARAARTEPSSSA